MTAIAETSAWMALRKVSSKWMYRPDFEALRIILAVARALDLPVRAVWLMILGPGSVGKTEYYLRAASAYTPNEMTDDVTIPGLISGSNGKLGEGILRRLSPKGLWLLPDFTAMLDEREERRNALLGAWRRIYDGRYDRIIDGVRVPWQGRINVILACTNAIERFYRVHADMGERFLTVRLSRPEPCDELVRKHQLQEENPEEFHSEIISSAKDVLRAALPSIDIPFELRRQILEWASLISIARTSVQRNFKDEIVAVGQEEGASRAANQLTSIVAGDASLRHHAQAGARQLSLVRRVAFDSMPYNRRAILMTLPPDLPISSHELLRMSGISHRYTFDRTVDELTAIGAISREESALGWVTVKAGERLRPLLEMAIPSES